MTTAQTKKLTRIIEDLETLQRTIQDDRGDLRQAKSLLISFRQSQR